MDGLRAAVGDSGRHVVVMSHCGVERDWWHLDDWAAFYDAARPYNVVAFLYGHSGTGLRAYKPEGEERPLTCVNTGQTEKGFFVTEITGKRLRLGYQVKTDPKAETPEWEWKYRLDKPVSRGAAP